MGKKESIRALTIPSLAITSQSIKVNWPTVTLLYTGHGQNRWCTTHTCKTGQLFKSKTSLYTPPNHCWRLDVFSLSIITAPGIMARKSYRQRQSAGPRAVQPQLIAFSHSPNLASCPLRPGSNGWAGVIKWLCYCFPFSKPVTPVVHPPHRGLLWGLTACQFQAKDDCRRRHALPWSDTTFHWRSVFMSQQ